MTTPFQLPEEYYLFERVEDQRIEYFFKTIHDVEYKAIFKPSPYIFGEDKPYAPLLYEFSVLAKFSGPKSFVRDDLIAPTVVQSFLIFTINTMRTFAFISAIRPMEGNM